jgi:hypothetical protein
VSTKVRSEVSQQENRIINGDLTVTGNILGKWASKIQAMLDTVLGSKWKAIDFYAPVAGEPSLGTPHPTSDANRSATRVVNTSANTANVWSAAVTMTGVPVGAKSAYCVCEVSIGGNTVILAVEAATGYTLSSLAGAGYTKYHCLYAPVIGGIGLAVLRIHLDANGQFKWCSNQTNANVGIGSAIDYDE